MATIGICGDNCDACPRFHATSDNDDAALGRVTALWVRLGWRDNSVKPSELRCSGCGSSGACAYSQQKDCASERGLANCGECDDYPCPVVEKTFARTEGIMAQCRSVCNVEELKELDLAFGRKKENLDRIREAKEARRK